MNRDDDQENTPPKYHFKCRFHDEDAYCITQIYTRTDKTPVNLTPTFIQASLNNHVIIYIRIQYPDFKYLEIRSNGRLN